MNPLKRAVALSAAIDGVFLALCDEEYNQLIDAWTRCVQRPEIASVYVQKKCVHLAEYINTKASLSVYLGPCPEDIFLPMGEAVCWIDAHEYLWLLPVMLKLCISLRDDIFAASLISKIKNKNFASELCKPEYWLDVIESKYLDFMADMYEDCCKLVWDEDQRVQRNIERCNKTIDNLRGVGGRKGVRNRFE